MVEGRAAFFKIGSFSGTNTFFLNALKRALPEVEFDVIDIRQLAGERRDLVNFVAAAKEYAADILSRRKNFLKCLNRTPYIFDKVKRLANKKLVEQDYLFSFQMQSLYDCSSDHIPHFLYTDHTHLANMSYPEFQEQHLSSESWRERERTIYENARLCFTMSGNIRDSIINEYDCDPRKVRCVFGGPNVQFPDRQKMASPDKSKNILFVGVKWERKGGPELVSAFTKVLERHPDATLTIVGCKPQIELPNCHVLGRVASLEVQSYYRNAGIFCLPTRQEPFGIVFIEAFCYGLPIVATNIGAIPEFVISGETGYVVEPGNSDQLAEQLCLLLDDSTLRRNLGENGRALVKQKYSWEQTAKQVASAIAEIV